MWRAILLSALAASSTAQKSCETCEFVAESMLQIATSEASLERQRRLINLTV